MHAFLITGATGEKRQEKRTALLDDWHITPADIASIHAEGEHITIDMVRAFQKRLLLAPMMSPYTAGVIAEAHVLTVEAQQALLKLVEEPPPRAYIVLEAESADQLLPTIVSRCQIIRLSETLPNINTDILAALLDKKPTDVFAEVDKHTTDRIEAKQWAGELLTASRAMLLATPSKKMASLVRRLLAAQKALNVNCNPKLVLDRVFMGLSET